MAGCHAVSTSTKASRKGRDSEDHRDGRLIPGQADPAGGCRSCLSATPAWSGPKKGRCSMSMELPKWFVEAVDFLLRFFDDVRVDFSSSYRTRVPTRKVECVAKYLDRDGDIAQADALRDEYKRWLEVFKSEPVDPDSIALTDVEEQRLAAMNDEDRRLMREYVLGSEGQLRRELRAAANSIRSILAACLETPSAASGAGEDEKPDVPPVTPEKALLDTLNDELTPQGWRIVSYLWNKPRGASYDTLAGVRGAFRGGPTDEAIEKALKRIGDYFNKNLDLNLQIQISPAKRRAKLIRPADK